MSVPALKEIRRRFPNARISLLVRPWVQDVYAAADFVDEILLYHKPGKHQGWNGMRRLAVELRRRRFEMTILLQNAIEAALIAFWARIPLRLGYARDGRRLLLTHAIQIDPAVSGLHQAYYYLGILAGAGLIENRPWEHTDYRLDSIEIRVRESDSRAAREMLRTHGIDPGAPVVGLNPGASYGSSKRWPTERFAAVADTLAREFGARIVIFGAPREIQVACEVAARMISQPVVLAGRTTLGQLMGLIRECNLFITNDSGPMHLAAALNVPQLAIFGSTSEIATGPLSDRAQVIKHQVDCNPCFLRECPIDFRCMLGVAVDDVVRAARGKLSVIDAGGEVKN
ncbi:MAG: lipopolysaccharide heptosyltransferase II [Acidobacteriia bacterium]|nr:lipopolysaccharide heptosyltransferase II [Terriglobia bacterium]